MQVTCQVNTKGFEAACLALAKVSGRSMEQVVTSELGKVIDKTIEYTPISSKSKIDAVFNKATFTSQPETLYAPKQRTVSGYYNVAARRVKKGKVLYYLENRYPDILWQRITDAREKSRKLKHRAIGLARKSWIDIAVALGLTIIHRRSAKAMARTGKDYPEDISTSKSVRETDIAVAFINAQPTVNVIGGRSALQSAINNRVKAFLTNVKLGVFDSMKNIARQYPGLKISAP